MKDTRIGTMITLKEVKQISDRLIMENTDIQNDNPGEDLSELTDIST